MEDEKVANSDDVAIKIAGIEGPRSPERGTSTESGSKSFRHIARSNAEVTEFDQNLKPEPNEPTQPVLVSSSAPSSSGDDDESDDDVLEEIKKEKGTEKLKASVFIEWVAFACVVGLLICSLGVHKLRKEVIIWDFKLWRWCVLVLVTFCGRLLTNCLMNVLFFFLEIKLLFKVRALFIVYGLRTSFRFFIWLAMILLVWILLFDHQHHHHGSVKILNHITKAVVSTLAGVAIWLVRTFLVKLLIVTKVPSFSLQKIQDSIYDHHLLSTLKKKLFGVADICGCLT